MITEQTKQNLIAAFPIFLIGLGISGGCLIAGGACYEIPSWRLYSGIAFGGLIALFIGAIGVFGVIKRIPDWSIIWIATSMIGFLVLINFTSSFGLPSVLEIAILIFSIVIGLTIFYFITKKNWHSAALLGVGLSTALSLILFFMANNISHNRIKIGYFDFIIGFIMSGMIYLFLKGNNHTKRLIIILFLALNSIMVLVFNMNMQHLNQESHLLYLLVFSNGLLFSGIVFHYLIRLIDRIISK